MALSIAFTLLLSVIPTLAGPLLDERNVCNRDNVLRALVDSRNIGQAIPFCSTYIHVPASTITATTGCVTATVTLIVDPLPVTTTVTPTVTVTTTSQKTVYSAYTPPYNAKKWKRDQAVPTFVSQYEPSRISSACSCLTITPSTITKPCPTSTVVSTIKPAPPTFTVTASPPATVTQTVAGPTVTLPAICKPSLFLEYLGGVDSAGLGGLVTSTETTEQACCVACFKAKNCTAFQFRPDNGPEALCEYYTRRAPTDPTNRKDICPFGVSKKSELNSPAGIGKGPYYNYGPCLEKSPLSG